MSLRPIAPKALAVLIDKTLMAMAQGGLWKLPDNWPELAPIYRAALGHLPHDLAERALQRATLELKFFPKPAELRELVADDLARRVRAFNQAVDDVKRWKAGRVSIRAVPTADERESVSRIVGETTTLLRRIAADIVPRAPVADENPPADAGYARRVADELNRIGPTLRQIRQEELGE